MADDIATLTFDIDSGPARTAATDLARLQAAAVSLAQKAADAGKIFNKETGQMEHVLRNANGTFRSSAEVVSLYGDKVKSLTQEFNPALAAAQRLESWEVRLAEARSLGIVTTQKQADALRDRYVAALRQTIPEVREAEELERRRARTLEDLRTKYIPLYAASKQYEAELARINAELAEGNLQQGEYDRMLANMNAQFNVAANGARKFGAATQASAHHISNLSFQINDIGMMMALGQSPFMLMMQQGPQVAQIFSQITAEGKKIGPALLGGLRAVLNPMTFITLAAIGGSAALFQWGRSFFEASEEVKEFDSLLDRLESNVRDLSNAMSANSMSADDLASKYGNLKDQAREWLAIDLQRVLAQATIAMQENNRELQDSISEYATARASVDAYRNQINAIQRDLGLSRDEAEEFRRTLSRMLDANGIEEFALRADDVRMYMEGAGIAIEDLPPALEDAITGIAPLVLSSLELKNNMEAAQIAVGGLAGNWAEMLALPEVSTTTLSPVRPSRTGGGGGGGQSEADRIREQMKQRLEALNEGMLSETALAMAHYARDQEALEYALNNKLISQQEYNARLSEIRLGYFGLEAEQNAVNHMLEQEALQAALDNKLLSQEEYYRRLRELQDNYYSNAITTPQNLWAQELSGMSSHFAQMNSLAGGGYDKLERAQKTFAASSALINAYLAATQALADPSVPFWGKFAAYAKVLAAGIGAVKAIKGSGSGGSASSATATATATSAEPQRSVYVNLAGPAWMQDLVEDVITDIYQQSKDGRVIIARDN